MSKKVKLIIFIMIFNSLCLLGAEFHHKMSGKVHYKGKGMKNITLAIVGEVNTPFKFKRIKTDQDGNFSFLHPDGSFMIGINDNDDKDEFFCPIDFKNIHVKGKPVDDIIFPLEKFCTIAGKIEVLNLDSIDGAIFFKNKRGDDVVLIAPDGSFVADSIKAAKDTSIVIKIEGIIDYLDSGTIDLIEGQSITNFKRTVSPFLTIITNTIKTLKPIKSVLARIYRKNEGKYQLYSMGWVSEKGVIRFSEKRFPPGEYSIFAEASNIPYYSIMTFDLVGGNPKEIVIELEKRDRDILKKDYPFLFNILEKNKKELETLLLLGGENLHDTPSQLMYYGDMESIPVLIKTLKTIYKIYPHRKTDDGYFYTICTHQHLIDTIKFIAKENPGSNLKEIEAWWEKKRQQLKKRRD